MVFVHELFCCCGALAVPWAGHGVPRPPVLYLGGTPCSIPLPPNRVRAPAGSLRSQIPPCARAALSEPSAG